MAADPRSAPVTEDQPTVDDCHDRLRRAGWSVGDCATAGGTWLVTGSNGENLIRAVGHTQAEAWRGAAEQARSLGMLRGVRGNP